MNMQNSPDLEDILGSLLTQDNNRDLDVGQFDLNLVKFNDNQ